MNIALAASEAVPFCKTGGLADVVGALARIFAREPGHKVCLFLPLYRGVHAGPFALESLPGSYLIPIGEGFEKARLARAKWGGVDVYFVDNPKYFDRDELYGAGGTDYLDNDERFVFFSRAVLEGLKYVDFKPDVLHCHDWQTALIPAYLRTAYQIDSFFVRTASVLTMHNAAYQGLFSKDTLFLAGFGWADFTPDKLEYYGGFNFLKAGIVYADQLTTVSPSYAREIQSSAEFGRGLEGVLRERGDRLTGILNGIDSEDWSPETDPHLAAQYGPDGFAQGKAACKKAFQAAAGLDTAPRAPLIGVVSRLDQQKGLDAALDAIDAAVAGGAQAAVVGTGDPDLHEGFSRLAKRHRGKVFFKGGFDEALGHKIYAAADIFLMPSRFEPCGLGQMIAMTYGAVPVVTRTGGLSDTVAGWGADPKAANGFVAAKCDPGLVQQALASALALYKDEKAWAGLVRRAMASDFSWERSAKAYLGLFEKASKMVKEGA